MKLLPKDNQMFFNIKEMSFATKQRRRTNFNNQCLTRRDCISKVSNFFLNWKNIINSCYETPSPQLSHKKLDWEDDDERNQNLKISTCHNPENAADTYVETLDFGDASKDIPCIAIYAISNVKTVAVHAKLHSQDLV